MSILESVIFKACRILDLSDCRNKILVSCHVRKMFFVLLCYEAKKRTAQRLLSLDHLLLSVFLLQPLLFSILLNFIV